VSYKDDHREFQELVRELMLLRSHNQGFGPNNTQEQLLLLSEGAMTLVALERFLRMVLGNEAGDEDTLPNLLEKATGKRLHLLTLPGSDRERLIRALTDVRNTILHGNYEQAARNAGCSGIREYFQAQFAAEVETTFQITDALVKQIDPETGRPLARV
jgi:hypothetical protein